MVDLESVVAMPAGVLRSLVWFWQNEAPADPMTEGDIDIADVLGSIESIASLMGIGVGTLYRHIATLRQKGWIYEAHSQDWLRRAVIVWPTPGQRARQGKAAARVVTDTAAQKEAREELLVLDEIRRGKSGGAESLYDVWQRLREPPVAAFHAQLLRLSERGIVVFTGTNLVVVPARQRALAIETSKRRRAMLVLQLVGPPVDESVKELREDAR